MRKAVTYNLIFTTLLLTSCGWQLRGSEQTDPVYSIYLNVDDRSAFAKTLTIILNNQRVKLTGKPADARYQLVILNEQSNDRTATITSSARTATLLVSEQVTFSVLDADNQVLLAKTTLKGERTLDFDENQVISKAEEMELVRRELRDDLARQIIDRLQRLKNL